MNIQDSPTTGAIWSGSCPIPSIGDRVRVTMNTIGTGHVSGFFTEQGYQGVQVKLDFPWFNGSRLITSAHVFGAEIAPSDSSPAPYCHFVHALAAAKELFPRDFADRIRLAWINGNYSSLNHLSAELQSLRNSPHGRSILDWFAKKQNYNSKSDLGSPSAFQSRFCAFVSSL